MLTSILTYTCRNYDPYFSILPVEAGPNQSLFWFGTYSIVKTISKNNLGVTVMSSANEQSSEIINLIGEDIKETPFWCGRKGG